MEVSKKAILLKTVIFICLFCVIFYYTQELLRAKWGKGTAGAQETINAKGFYNEPENSLDVMYFGSSHAFFGISPMKIWEQYGFTSYVRGSANQPIFLTYYYIKDSLKSQSPKAIVLDVGYLVNNFDPIAEEWVARRGLDYLRLSDSKIEAIRNLAIDGSSQKRITYLLPLLRYHSRWKDLTKADFDYFSWDWHNNTKGQYLRFDVIGYKLPADYMIETDASIAIPEETKKWFLSIVKLCEESNVQLFLIKTPVGPWTYSKHNAIQEIADELELEFVDYNLLENREAIGFNSETDFAFNEWHLGAIGAEKLSVHLGAFLQNEMNLPDRRQDPEYSSWHEDLAAYNTIITENGG